MNPVNFNAPFLAFADSHRQHKRAIPGAANVDERAFRAMTERAPLFHFRHDFDERKALGGASADPLANRELIFTPDGTCRLPFPVTRMAIESTNTKGDGFNIIASSDHSEGLKHGPMTRLAVDMRMRHAYGPEAGLGGMDAMLALSFRMNAASKDDPDGGVYCDVRVFETKRWAEITSQFSRYKREQLAMTVTSRLFIFLFDVNSPANHVAIVTPPGADKKSVEWTAAREHYVILDRRHAANQATVAKGATVQSDDSKTMERIAHNRRAHWRHFKSEKFKNVRNTRRWIKDIWVGPEEWRDQGGSIYKLIR